MVACQEPVVPRRMTRTTKGAVLVVDADDAMRRAVCLALAADGYDTLQARDGAEALALLQRWTRKVSLIILDLSSGRRDGVRFKSAHAADPQLARIPVIACASSDEHSFHVHASAHFKKPFSMHELVARVRAWARA